MHPRYVLALACALLLYAAPASVSAQRILIYGPGGTASMPHFPPGVTVTVAAEPMWRALTTADFRTYDLLWVDGNNCESRPAMFQALVDTQATWGPAVTGRVAINVADPDWHSQTMFIQNHVRYVGALGATATGGRTGMYFSTGCNYYTDTLGPPYIEAFEPTFGAPMRTILMNGNPTAVLDPTHPLLAGYPDPTSLSWGNYCHGGIATPFPTGWTSLVVCHGGSGLLVREMPGMPSECGNGIVEGAEPCDDGNMESCDGCTPTCMIDPDGCTIGTACVADGDASPLNPCEVCDIATSRTEYSPAAAGVTCDDGFFCTQADACDGAGGCDGTDIECDDGMDCTTDTCDEDADACMSEPSPPGTRCGGDPMCMDGFIMTAPVCDEAGICVPGERRPCPGPDGAPCDPEDPRMCLGGGCRDDSECIEGLRCVGGACVPEDTGETCTDDTDCDGGFCTDGVCCDARCDGVCEGCSLFGICTSHPAGTDPEDECVLECRGTSACEEPDAGGGDPDAGGDGGGIDAGTGVPRSGGGCCSVAAGARSGRNGALGLLTLIVGLFVFVRVRRRRR